MSAANILLCVVLSLNNSSSEAGTKTLVKAGRRRPRNGAISRSWWLHLLNIFRESGIPRKPFLTSYDWTSGSFNFGWELLIARGRRVIRPLKVDGYRFYNMDSSRDVVWTKTIVDAKWNYLTFGPSVKPKLAGNLGKGFARGFSLKPVRKIARSVDRSASSEFIPSYGPLQWSKHQTRTHPGDRRVDKVVLRNLIRLWSSI